MLSWKINLIGILAGPESGFKMAYYNRVLQVLQSCFMQNRSVHTVSESTLVRRNSPIFEIFRKIFSFIFTILYSIIAKSLKFLLPAFPFLWMKLSHRWMTHQSIEKLSRPIKWLRFEQWLIVKPSVWFIYTRNVSYNFWKNGSRLS